MTVQLQFITTEERDSLNDKHIKAGGYRDQFEPGTIYYATWLHNPGCKEDLQRLKQYTGNWRYLSDMFWQEWADKRSPLICMLPDGRQWCLDSRATNGSGWTVKLDDGIIPSASNRTPRITANPSILTDGYHGFLRGGILVTC